MANSGYEITTANPFQPIGTAGGGNAFNVGSLFSYGSPFYGGSTYGSGKAGTTTQATAASNGSTSDPALTVPVDSTPGAGVAGIVGAATSGGILPLAIGALAVMLIGLFLFFRK